jgi:hypothetical protein
VLPTTRNLNVANVLSFGMVPPSNTYPLPGIPLSMPRPKRTIFDSAAAQAGSLRMPSMVMAAPLVERAQMTFCRTGSAEAIEAPASAAAMRIAASSLFMTETS